MCNANQINRDSWDRYQADYMRFQLMARPDYFEFLSSGGVDLDEYLIELIGDVRGLSLLDTCCASDAVKSFSWHNLGARVTACDITPSAIKIARENAMRMKLDLDFIEDDMQTLEKIPDASFDIIFATYPVWLSDINEACRTWRRVLKPGGRLIWHMEHPVRSCIKEHGGELEFSMNYNEPDARVYASFQGTPLADKFGGWSTDLPSVEHFYRVSDLMNAACGAGFRILKIHEACDADVPPPLRNLPSDMVILAQRE
jgi:ubiquinone/menaquinone biosynthesis C-methylase UbiE